MLDRDLFGNPSSAHHCDEGAEAVAEDRAECDNWDGLASAKLISATVGHKLRREGADYTF